MTETTQLRVRIDPRGQKSRVFDAHGAVIEGVYSVSVEQKPGEAPLVTIKIYAINLDLTLVGKDTPQ